MDSEEVSRASARLRTKWPLEFDRDAVVTKDDFPYGYIADLEIVAGAHLSQPAPASDEQLVELKRLCESLIAGPHVQGNKLLVVTLQNEHMVALSRLLHEIIPALVARLESAERRAFNAECSGGWVGDEKQTIRILQLEAEIERLKPWSNGISIPMGLGSVIVYRGVTNGVPCVVVEEAKRRGAVGTSASEDDGANKGVNLILHGTEGAAILVEELVAAAGLPDWPAAARELEVKAERLQAAFTLAVDLLRDTTNRGARLLQNSEGYWIDGVCYGADLAVAIQVATAAPAKEHE